MHGAKINVLSIDLLPMHLSLESADVSLLASPMIIRSTINKNVRLPWQLREQISPNRIIQPHQQQTELVRIRWPAHIKILENSLINQRLRICQSK
jgi:hypothetical protein